MTITNRDLKYLATALCVGQIWSKDPSTKVGAIAVGERKGDVAWGYNGFPPGIEDTDERLKDREFKLAHTIHAEPNALDNAHFDAGTLYVTGHPCAACSLKILARPSVRRVVYLIDLALEERWKDSIAEARKNFAEAGVEIEGVERSALSSVMKGVHTVSTGIVLLGGMHEWAKEGMLKPFPMGGVISPSPLGPPPIVVNNDYVVSVEKARKMGLGMMTLRGVKNRRRNAADKLERIRMKFGKWRAHIFYV